MLKADQFERVHRWLTDQLNGAEALEEEQASIDTMLDQAEYELDRLRRELGAVLLEAEMPPSKLGKPSLSESEPHAEGTVATDRASDKKAAA